MPLRVKFLAKFSSATSADYWKNFLPGGDSTVGEVTFIFDPLARQYDWLVVYDDLPASAGERHTLWEERLACPRENSLLITTEPSTIKVYGNAFLAQFGHVLTSQEPFAIRHPHVIHSQCGLLWFYGKSHQQATQVFPTDKSRSISTVCSSKRQRHTLHARRLTFTRQLKQSLPELEVYGHGHRPIPSKIEALDPFCYHLAIENHRAPHHWTEKLADAYLAGCLPIYDGCPNVTDYFPEESLIRIHIDDFESSLQRIRETILGDAWHERLVAIREARRRVLEEYSLFPMLGHLIPSLHLDSVRGQTNERILSRHVWRRKHPIAAIGYGIERMRVRLQK